MKINANKILIIKWGALGDMIMSTSAIRAVRENYPEAHIALLSNSLMPQIIPPGTLVDESIIYDEKKYRGIKSFLELLKLVLVLRRRKYDLAINLRWTSDRCAVIAYLSGAKERVSSGPKNMMNLYTIRLDHPVGRYHELHRNLDIVKAVGIKVTNEVPFIFISEENKKFANDYFIQLKLIKERTVLIHPGASKPNRAWAPERYKEIALRLANEFNLNILVTWGINELNWAAKVADGTNHKIVLAPSTSCIGDLAALIKNCALCITNCTGPMNVAVAVETPTIAFLGSSHPVDWGPYFPIHTIIKSPMDQETYTDEEERLAMEAISIEMAWNIIKNRCEELFKN